MTNFALGLASTAVMILLIVAQDTRLVLSFKSGRPAWRVNAKQMMLGGNLCNAGGLEVAPLQVLCTAENNTCNN
jgi:hypothetical protein